MGTETKRFSVVMTVNDNATELEQNLPVFLEQDYEAGYEVIIVDESSTDNTDDVLKLQKATHPHLYTTFLPKPNPHVSRQRLALTIGVKAAKHDWLVLTNIHAPVPSADWLTAMAEATDEPMAAVVLGYARKDGKLRFQTFDSIDDARHHIRLTERKQANGHRGKRLRYLRGKYDYLAVRTKDGHEALRHFEQPVKGFSLLGLRLRIAFHNLFH